MLRVLSICFALLSGTQAFAQDWPSRAVHLVVPYAAGGGTDTVARVLAQKLSIELGQHFVVENKPGAGGMSGAPLVAKSAPDGYTLLVASPAEIALNQNLFTTMTYDPLKDFAPVTLLAWTPLVMAAHPDFPASTPQELVALAKKEQVDFSTPGIGSSHHLTGEYFNHVAGTKLPHVPYRGAAPAVTDAVAGQVKLTISGMPPVVPFLKANKLKAIAVTSKQRSPQFPNVPAMSEVKGFEDFDFTNWFGLLAPAGTPKDIIEKFNAKIVEIANTDDMKKRMREISVNVPLQTPAEMAAFLKSDFAANAEVIKAANVKLE